jgi:hypothetical protein
MPSVTTNVCSNFSAAAGDGIIWTDASSGCNHHRGSWQSLALHRRAPHYLALAQESSRHVEDRLDARDLLFCC